MIERAVGYPITTRFDEDETYQLALEAKLSPLTSNIESIIASELKLFSKKMKGDSLRILESPSLAASVKAQLATLKENLKRAVLSVLESSFQRLSDWSQLERLIDGFKRPASAQIFESPRRIRHSSLPPFPKISLEANLSDEVFPLLSERRHSEFPVSSFSLLQKKQKKPVLQYRIPTFSRIGLRVETQRSWQKPFKTRQVLTQEVFPIIRSHRSTFYSAIKQPSKSVTSILSLRGVNIRYPRL